jgi:uncharacterized membrane protein
MDVFPRTVFMTLMAPAFFATWKEDLYLVVIVLYEKSSSMSISETIIINSMNSSYLLLPQRL